MKNFTMRRLVFGYHIFCEIIVAHKEFIIYIDYI